MDDYIPLIKYGVEKAGISMCKNIYQYIKYAFFYDSIENIGTYIET